MTPSGKHVLLACILALGIAPVSRALTTIYPVEAIRDMWHLPADEFRAKYAGISPISGMGLGDEGWYVRYQHANLTLYFGPLTEESEARKHMWELEAVRDAAVRNRQSLESSTVDYGRYVVADRDGDTEVGDRDGVDMDGDGLPDSQGAGEDGSAGTGSGTGGLSRSGGSLGQATGTGGTGTSRTGSTRRTSSNPILRGGTVGGDGGSAGAGQQQGRGGRTNPLGFPTPNNPLGGSFPGGASLPAPSSPQQVAGTGGSSSGSDSGSASGQGTQSGSGGRGGGQGGGTGSTSGGSSGSSTANSGGSSSPSGGMSSPGGGGSSGGGIDPLGAVFGILRMILGI